MMQRPLFIFRPSYELVSLPVSVGVGFVGRNCRTFSQWGRSLQDMHDCRKANDFFLTLNREYYFFLRPKSQRGKLFSQVKGLLAAEWLVPVFKYLFETSWFSGTSFRALVEANHFFFEFYQSLVHLEGYDFASLKQKNFVRYRGIPQGTTFRAFCALRWNPSYIVIYQLIRRWFLVKDRGLLWSLIHQVVYVRTMISSLKDIVKVSAIHVHLSGSTFLKFVFPYTVLRRHEYIGVLIYGLFLQLFLG